MFRALISVSDKTGLHVLGKGLVDRFGGDLMIISTGGTCKALEAEKISVMKIESITGVPEVMDGRVKTIHPKIAGGILAKRDNPKHMQQLEEVLRAGTIDLVVVNLYPFAKAAANPHTSFNELIEEIDIGGPTLLRAAAKNFRDVIVIVDPVDYERLLEQLAQPGGPTLGYRFEMMKKVFRLTHHYDGDIVETLDEFHINADKFYRCPT
ncbi:MAG: IMP cyclohydrolase [Candidatus Doudnabacteria bacterium]